MGPGRALSTSLRNFYPESAMESCWRAFIWGGTIYNTKGKRTPRLLCAGWTGGGKRGTWGTNGEDAGHHCPGIITCFLPDTSLHLQGIPEGVKK